MLESCIEQLVKELELSPVAELQDGSFQVAFSDNQVLILKPLGQGMSAHIEIGTLPTEQQEEALEHLMYANLFSQGTGAACTLGLKKNKETLILRSEDPFLKSYEHFKFRLETLLNYADYWQDALAKAVAKKTSPLFEM